MSEISKFGETGLIGPSETIRSSTGWISFLTAIARWSLERTVGLIGLVGLVPLLAPFAQLPTFGSQMDAPFSAEVGLFLMISPAMQGQGFATEAGRSRQFCFRRSEGGSNLSRNGVRQLRIDRCHAKNWYAYREKSISEPGLVSDYGNSPEGTVRGLGSENPPAIAMSHQKPNAYYDRSQKSPRPIVDPE